MHTRYILPYMLNLDKIYYKFVTEKTYIIKHMLEQEAHMDTQEVQTWTKILLDTLGDERKTTNILSFLFSIFQ